MVVGPSARALSMIAALVAVNIKLSLGREPYIDDPDVLSLMQMQHTLRAGRRNSSSKVVFIKTHCTGSTTLAGILQRYCDLHSATCAQGTPHRYIGGTVQKGELQDYVKSNAGKPDVDIWPWHVVYDKHTFEQLIPGAMSVSILRDPVPRQASCWAHGDAEREERRLWLHNLKTNGDIPECKGTMHGQIGKLSDVDLVLLTDYYDLSLVLFARNRSWPLETLLYTKERVSQIDESYQKVLDDFKEIMSQPMGNMTETARVYFKACMEKDRQMYVAAQERFQKRLDAMPREQYAEVQRDTGRLQSANQVLQHCCAEKPSDAYCRLLSEDPRDWNRRMDKGLPPPAGVESADCRQMALIALSQS